MNAADLAAIRERNEARKKGSCYDCGHAHDDSDARLDIDALLVEVARLLAADEVRARDISRLTEERDNALDEVAKYAAHQERLRAFLNDRPPVLPGIPYLVDEAIAQITRLTEERNAARDENETRRTQDPTMNDWRASFMRPI